MSGAVATMLGGVMSTTTLGFAAISTGVKKLRAGGPKAEQHCSASSASTIGARAAREIQHLHRPSGRAAVATVVALNGMQGNGRSGMWADLVSFGKPCRVASEGRAFEERVDPARSDDGSSNERYRRAK